MLKDKIIPEIMSYIKHAYEWQQQPDKSVINDGPGMMMIELEESILTQFGLPTQAFRYSNILQQEGFSIQNIEDRAEVVYNILLHEAEYYFLSPVLLNVDILKTAKLSFAASQDVLPYLGFEITVYTNFLYYDIYLMGLCTEGELLECLEKAKVYNVSPKRYIPYTFIDFNTSKNTNALRKYNLPFFEQYGDYLFYLFCSGQRDTQEKEIILGANNEFNDGLIDLETFYITEITVRNIGSCQIELIFEQNGELRMIHILCNQKMLVHILTYATYYSVASSLVMNINLLQDESYPFNYDPLFIQGMYIEISKCHIELDQLLNLEDDDIDDNLNFIINSITLNDQNFKLQDSNQDDLYL